MWNNLIKGEKYMIDKINEFNIPIFSEGVISEIESNIKVFRENISQKQQLIVEIQDILNSSYNQLLRMQNI